MAVHQTARFINSPMLSPEKSIKRLGQYLYHTNKEGIINNPDTSKVLDFYVDGDFAGRWQQADANDSDNVISRTGMVIMYANCPIFWYSSLKTEISISTVKAEHIAFSSALIEGLPLMTMIKSIYKVFPLLISKPNLFFKLYKDNQ